MPSRNRLLSHGWKNRVCRKIKNIIACHIHRNAGKGQSTCWAVPSRGLRSDFRNKKKTESNAGNAPGNRFKIVSRNSSNLWVYTHWGKKRCWHYVATKMIMRARGSETRNSTARQGSGFRNFSLLHTIVQTIGVIASRTP